MSGPSRVDPATLGWVKVEIDQTIGNARNALAEYSSGSDVTPLRMYASHLHQVVGTLQMVELYGAAHLAQEAESLADALIAGDNGGADSARLLDSALEKLSEYLDKLNHGMPDLPMQNVAVLNELRHARGASPVNEAALFNPDLNVFPPDHEPQKLAESEYSERALQLRRDYQNRLLSWLRNSDNDVLGSMRDIVDRLREISRFGAVSQLWWVAGAYLDLLQETRVDDTDPRKRILGQLDQQIRRLVEDGEAALVREPPEELVKAMLYEIGRSQVQTSRTQQVKEMFELDLILTGVSPDFVSAMALVPSSDTLNKLNQQVRNHLTTAQSRLSEYFGPDGGNSRTMIMVIENVTAVSAAAKQLDINGIADLSGEIAKVCVAIKEGKEIDVDGASLQLAAALLFIEETLKNESAPGIEWNDQVDDKIQRLRKLYADPLDLETLTADGMEVKEETLSESDFKRVLGAVASEVYVNLHKSEEALEAFAIEPSKQDALQPVAQYLDQVQGALRILGQHRVGDLLQSAIENIEKLQQGQIKPSAELVDALAVAIGTTETYVQGLQQDRPNLTEIVDRAMADLENAVAHRSIGQRDAQSLIQSMHENLDLWLQDNGDYRAFRSLRQNLRDVSAVANRRDKEKPRQIAQEMNNLLDIVTEDASFLSSEVESTLRRSLQILEDLVEDLVDPDQPSIDVSTAQPASSVADSGQMEAPRQDDELQSEILGVFLEEGAECVDVMDRCFAAWRQDPHNNEVLTELRRQFHTMKGSGRIAEAGEIAELAWVVEDVLNQVIANKLGVSDELYEFIADATAAVRSLLADNLGSSSQVDLASWRKRADRLSEYGGAEVDSAKATQAALGIDDTVIRIFSQETLAHIETVRQAVDDCRNRNASCEISAELSRAVHTLRGSSRSLHLVEMADAFGALDELLEDVANNADGLQTADLEILENIAQLSARTLDKLNQERRFPEALRREFELLKEQIEARASGAPASETVGGAPAVTEQMATGPATAAGGGLEDQINALEDLIPKEVTEELRSDAAPPVDDDSLDLHDIFCEEAMDILERVNTSLHHWREGGAANEAVAALKRDLHTLKGSARAAGAATVGDLSHNTESLLDHLRDRPHLVGDSLLHLVEEVHDSLAHLIDQMDKREPLGSIDELNQRLISLDARLTAGEAIDVSMGSAARAEVAEAAPDTDTLSQVPAAAMSPETGAERPAVMASSSAGLDKQEEKREAPVLEDTAEENKPLPSVFEQLEDHAAAPLSPTADMEWVTRSGNAAAPTSVAQASANKPPSSLPSIASKPEASTAVREDPLQVPLAAAVGDDSASEAVGAREGAPADPRSQVRVKSQVLNQLMNYAGEVSIARSQMQEQLTGFRGNLNELRANVSRFHDQIRELEIQADAQIRSRSRDLEEGVVESDFDPLEFDRYTRLQQLSRSLSESLDDLVTIQGGLGTFANKTELVLRQQAHLSTDLQDGLMSTRLVPFSTVVPRLRHEVRLVSRELNKDAELEVIGGDVEIDRNILDSMSEAFAHMVRNALGHGIEPAEQRAQLGKPRVGKIRIECRQEGGEIILRFSDDGAGLDLEKIRTRALDAGMLKRDSQLSDDELTQLILLSGFSTADELTKLSGRGIGMDVVHNSVRRLGGTMTVETGTSGGASFLLHLPLSLSITQALFVRCGAQEFAIALNVIQTILKVEANKLGGLSKDGEPLFERDGQVYPLLDLARQLQVTSGLEESDERVPILMVRMGAREVAVKVDDLIGTQEVVVKNLGEHLAGVNGIAGATIRGDGSVALILDLAELWLAQERLPVSMGIERAAKPAAHAVPIVMVVDDSLTVRKVTSRNLSRYGMEVMMAKDGIDAMEQIRKTIPDLMLVDIEMPRMDGYELTSRIRSDPLTRDIPIVIITSRAGEKHRERALELGANAYLSKPYQEEDLIRHIKALLDQTPANFPTMH